MNFYRYAIAAVVLTGCATPEYRAEKSACEAEWINRIPPEFQQMTVQKTKAIQVPNGNVSCHSYSYGMSGMTNTSCTQGTRTEYVPYTAVETVDVRKALRDEQIRMCTTSSCYRNYGNSSCETEK